MWLKTLALIGLFSIVSAAVNYDNYKLYDIMPKSKYQAEMLESLKDEGYDFWNVVNVANKESRVLVAPENDAKFKEYVKSAGMVANLTSSNVQAMINEQMRPAFGRSARLGNYSWDQYHPLAKIESWLDELAELYPGIVTVVDIGSSYEGRPIKGVKIDKLAGQREGSPTMAFVEGGLHAREWISPATATWMIKEFLTSEDPEVQFLAEAVVWHIFPVTNPDGYFYSFDGDRMWRKNRNPLNRPAVPCANPDLGTGVDLNRNFDFMWNTAGTGLTNPCSQTYAGPSAASELETQHIAAYIDSIKPTGNLLYYFSLHSYSQMFLVPYSHVSGIGKLEVPNFGDLFEIAARGAEALTAVHGTPYQVGVSVELLYPVSGGGFDWALGTAEIPISILYELRDVGPYGFLLPPSEIIPNNEEVMASLVQMDKTTRDLGYYSYTRVAGGSGSGSGAAVVLSSMVSLVSCIVFIMLLK